MTSTTLFYSMKTCSCCEKDKPLDEFHKNRTRKDGRHLYCKDCRREKTNLDLRKARQRKWYLENRDDCIECQRQRYENKRDEIREYKQEHYLNNREHLIQKSQDNYKHKKDDPEFQRKRREYHRKWRSQNKHVVAWRSTLRSTLIRLKQTKNDSTETMLGYSAEELRIHLEKLWSPEMSWDNYGEWHIDHIKPVSLFSQSDLSSVVNALENLRPLWATTREVNGVKFEGNLNRKKI